MSLEAAVKVALSNPIPDLPRMAALIFDRKRLVSVGQNSRRTHRLALKFSGSQDKICIHAELAALIGARGADLSNSKMYVARVLKNDEPALAMPCRACQRAIAAFGIRDVEWTT